MNCDDAKQKLESYANGTIDADEKSPLEEHLAICEGCRLQMGLRRAILETPSVEMPASEGTLPPPAMETPVSEMIPPAIPPAEAGLGAPETAAPPSLPVDPAPIPEIPAAPSAEEFPAPPPALGFGEVPLLATPADETLVPTPGTPEPAGSDAAPPAAPIDSEISFSDIEIDIPTLATEPPSAVGPPPEAVPSAGFETAERSRSAPEAVTHWGFEPVDVPRESRPPEGSLSFAQEALDRKREDELKGRSAMVRIALWSAGALAGLALLGVSIWVALAVRGGPEGDRPGMRASAVPPGAPQAGDRENAAPPSPSDLGSDASPTLPPPAASAAPAPPAPDSPLIASVPPTPPAAQASPTPAAPGVAPAPAPRGPATMPAPKALAPAPKRTAAAVPKPPARSGTPTPSKQAPVTAPKPSTEPQVAKAPDASGGSAVRTNDRDLGKPIWPVDEPVSGGSAPPASSPPSGKAATAPAPAPRASTPQTAAPRGTGPAPAAPATQAPATPAPVGPQAAADTAATRPAPPPRPIDRLHRATESAAAANDLEALRKLKNTWKAFIRGGAGPDRARAKREYADCLWAIQSITGRESDQREARVAYRDYVLSAPAGGADARTVARMRYLEDVLSDLR